jgi:hypothetical protein
MDDKDGREDTAAIAGGDDDLRQNALRRLKKRQDFHAHVLVYVLVNGFSVIIWVLTSPGGFFWPVFLMAFWGIGLVMNAWDVYRKGRFSEQQVQAEIDRLQRQRS